MERVGRLEEGQNHLLERVGRLEEGHSRLEEGQNQLLERVGRLEESHRRLEESHNRLAEKFDLLLERVDRLEESHHRLEESHHRLEEKVDRLAESHYRLERKVDKIGGDVRMLMGDDYETHVATYVHRFLRREMGITAAVFSSQRDNSGLTRLLDEAELLGLIDPDDTDELDRADLVLTADGPTDYLVAEGLNHHPAE